MSSRTCSYLLGNRGCHSYNGNPTEELDLDEKTRVLIEGRVHESVGHITIGNDLTGTGFRVGTKYFMSAYHVFKPQISKMVDNILHYFLTIKTANEQTIEELEETLGIQRTPKDENPQNTANSLLQNYLIKHGTDIKRLLDCLKRLIATDPMTVMLCELWRPCFVEFCAKGRFYVDWNITFGDEEHDVIIVELKNENPREVPFPPPLLMDYKYRPEEDIQIVRYRIEDKRHSDDQTKMLSHKEIIVSTKCDLFCDNFNNFENIRQNCINWWEKWERKTEYIEDETIDFQSHFEKDCPSQYDKTTGEVITQASQSFIGGSSGSPMMYLRNDVKRPIVTSVFQGGLPKFYYEKTEKGNTFPRTGKDSEECGKHLFERGLSMEKICELLDAHRREDLKENILTPLKQVEDKLSNTSRRGEPTDTMKGTVEAWQREDRTCFLTEAVKETMKRITSNNCVCVTGDPGSGKSMSIRHAALQLRHERDFTVYPISSPDDFFTYFDDKKSQVFVIDDILGIHSGHKHLIDQWSKYHDAIKCLLGNDTKILASLRTHLVQHENIRLEGFVFLEKSKRVDFYDKRYRLDDDEMKNMLKWQLNVNNIENGEEIIAKIFGKSSGRKGLHVSDSFPLLCNMFCKNEKFRNDPKSFFRDPFRSLVNTFKRMKRENKPLFCGLILCAAFDGQLTGDYLSTIAEFEKKLDVETVALRNRLVVHLGLEPRSDLHTIKSELTAVDGVYVRRKGNDYEIFHRIFQDIVTFVYDDKPFLFKYGTSQFIKDRVRIRKLKHDDPFVIVCGGDTNIDKLATRLTEDLKNALADNSSSDQPDIQAFRAASFIVENPNIYEEKLIVHLRRLINRDDVEAVNILFKQCFFFLEENLKQSRDGDILQYELIGLLLGLGADCNMSIGYSWPLHIAVNACSMKLTRLLLDKGADMRICDLQSRSVLHMACSKYNTLSFVKLFIERGIDKIPAVRVLAVAKGKKKEKNLVSTVFMSRISST